MSLFHDIFPRSSTLGAKAGTPRPEGGMALSADGERLKNMLRRTVDAEGDGRWFEALDFSFSGEPPSVLSVALPHRLYFRWLDGRNRDALEKAVKELFGHQIAIHYVWPEKDAAPAPTAPSVFSGKYELSAHTQDLDDFIPGGRNRESIHLFRNALQEASPVLFLRGASGTGKTHLLRAAAKHLERSGRPCVLLSCRELLPLLESHNLRLPPSCCTLLVDDVHLLKEDVLAQRRLAALLDHLEGKVSVIATSLAGPDMEPGRELLPELYDRLCSHLVLELAEPDLDVRLRYTQQRMAKLGLPADKDIALTLARHCLRLRHIRGVLEQLRMRYEQNSILPSQEKLIQLAERNGSGQTVDVDSILAVVASRYGCSSTELRENTRNSRLSLPRQIAMYLCRDILGESYPSLGTIFGGRDHSTIMYAVRKINKTKVTNKDMHIQLTEMTKQCIHSAPRRRLSA